jgi:hypothetical protein
VFTARYALSPYIKQIRFVFKGLMPSSSVWSNSKRSAWLHEVMVFEARLEGWNKAGGYRKLPQPSFMFLRFCKYFSVTIPVAASSRAWVCGRSLAGVAGSNPTGGDGCLSLVRVVCCQVEVSASGWSLVQRSPTECGVSECDRKASKMRRPWPTRGYGKKILLM